MKGLILVNAYANYPSFLYQSTRLQTALNALGVETEIVKSDAMQNYIDGNGELISEWQGYEFCVYLDKDKYLSQMLEAAGIRLFNSHYAIETCDDKTLTFLRLSGSGIPVPKTYPAPLCYTQDAIMSEVSLAKLERDLGLPMIIKTSYGSLGKGVYKADTFDELRAVANELRFTPHLYQEFIKESAGKDIRVIVVGGKCITAMERKSESDFRSNIELGGRGYAFTPDLELQNLCETVAKTLKLDYCGIDILRSNRGDLVCEVNSNAFFGGIESVTGVAVAEAYAEHIYNEMQK